MAKIIIKLKLIMRKTKETEHYSNAKTINYYNQAKRTLAKNSVVQNFEKTEGSKISVPYIE